MPDSRGASGYLESPIVTVYFATDVDFLFFSFAFFSFFFFSCHISPYLSPVTRGDVDADDIPVEVRRLRFLDSHGALVLLTTAATTITTAVGCNCSFLLFRARGRNARGILPLLPRAL